MNGIIKVKMVLCHDDPPCSAPLAKKDSGRYCKKCGLYPDTQSVCLRAYCPDCDCPLQTDHRQRLHCPRCGKIAVKESDK